MIRSRSASRGSTNSLSSFVSSNRNSGFSTGSGNVDKPPNIIDLIPPPPTYPPPLMHLQSATHNGPVASHPVNAGGSRSSTWKRTTKNGLLREDSQEKRASGVNLPMNDVAHCQDQSTDNPSEVHKKPKLPPKKVLLRKTSDQSNRKHDSDHIVSWLPLLKKTSALSTKDTPPNGIFLEESSTSFASPKLAAKHANALMLAAVSKRKPEDSDSESEVNKKLLS